MRTVLTQSCSLDSLESRRLCASSHLVGEGFDLNFVSDLENDATPVVTESAEAFARHPIAGGFMWRDSTLGNVLQSGSNGHAAPLLVDNWGVWPSDGAGGVNRSGEPSEANTRALANYAVGFTDAIVLDIENWLMDPRHPNRAAVDQSIERFTRIVGWIRNQQPSLKVGIYGAFPLSDQTTTYGFEIVSEAAEDPVAGAWHRAVLPTYVNNFAKYQAANTYLSALASTVDYVMPALYTAAPADAYVWTRYAARTILEARRYGKPVVPFVMPTFHESSMPVITVMPQEFWQMELNVIRQYSDGAVIWTGPLAPTGWGQYWIDTANNMINADNLGGRGFAAVQSWIGQPGFNQSHNRTDSDKDDSDFSDVLIDELI